MNPRAELFHSCLRPTRPSYSTWGVLRTRWDNYLPQMLALYWDISGHGDWISATADPFGLTQHLKNQGFYVDSKYLICLARKHRHLGERHTDMT